MTTPRALRPRDGRFELFSFGDSRGSRRCAGGPGGRRYDEDNVAFKQSEESSLSGCLLSTSPVSCACLWVIISPADVSVEAVYYMGHQPCCEVCVCVCVCRIFHLDFSETLWRRSRQQIFSYHSQTRSCRGPHQLAAPVSGRSARRHVLLSKSTISQGF